MAPNADNDVQNSTVHGALVQAREINQVHVRHDPSPSPVELEIWRERYKLYSEFLEEWDLIKDRLMESCFGAVKKRNDIHLLQAPVNRLQGKITRMELLDMSKVTLIAARSALRNIRRLLAFADEIERTEGPVFEKIKRNEAYVHTLTGNIDRALGDFQSEAKKQLAYPQ